MAPLILSTMAGVPNLCLSLVIQQYKVQTKVTLQFGQQQKRRGSETEMMHHQCNQLGKKTEKNIFVTFNSGPLFLHFTLLFLLFIMVKSTVALNFGIGIIHDLSRSLGKKTFPVFLDAFYILNRLSNIRLYSNNVIVILLMKLLFLFSK